MAYNKVVYDGDTLIDLTQDNVTASDVKSGVYFHGADGVRTQGVLQVPVQNIWYATCSTSSDTYAKVATTTTGDFSLATGNMVRVKMTNACGEGVPTISVDGSTAKYINYDSSSGSGGIWGAGEVIDIVYDGAKFIVSAPTVRFGVTSTSSRQLIVNDDTQTFLTSYTETDPVFSASPASGITSTDITSWNGVAKNLKDGSATGSVRGVGTTEEGSGYTIGEYALAEGQDTMASGDLSHAEGGDTSAQGVASHAEGMSTNSYAMYSHAEGMGTEANGVASHSEGHSTMADGDYSHAEGDATYAEGDNSHAEGSGSSSNGDNSHAQNLGTVAGYDNQTAIGKYNSNISTSAFEIGNGTSDNARSNAFTVDWDGKIQTPQMQAGTITAASVSANSYTDVSVTFSSAMSGTPIVVCGVVSTSTAGAIGSITSAVTSTSTTGFTCRIFNAGSTGRTPAVNWIAMNI